MNVFSAIVNSPFDDLDISKLIHESSHDSCWRSDVKAFGDIPPPIARRAIEAEASALGLSPPQSPIRTF